MNHPFNKSTTNPALCQCGFDFLSHTKAARCMNCDAIGEVNIYKNHVICAACLTQYEVGMNNDVLDADTFLRLTMEGDVTQIRYSGDVFNAKTLANAEIKKKIFEDENLTDEQKHQKYFQFLADRYTHFKQVIFEQSSIIHDSNVEVIVISNELREYGNKVRTEIREQIKQSDEFYAPSIVNRPKVQPKIAKKLSPLDKMIKTMMDMTGKTETECRLLIEKGNFGKKTDNNGAEGH